MKITEEQRKMVLEALEAGSMDSEYGECVCCKRDSYHDATCPMLRAINLMGGDAITQAEWEARRKARYEAEEAERDVRLAAREAAWDAKLEELGITREDLQRVVEFRDWREGPPRRTWHQMTRHWTETSGGHEWGVRELEYWVGEWRKEVQ